MPFLLRKLGEARSGQPRQDEYQLGVDVNLRCDDWRELFAEELVTGALGPGWAVAGGGLGATTVSATLWIARRAGVESVQVLRRGGFGMSRCRLFVAIMVLLTITASAAAGTWEK